MGSPLRSKLLLALALLAAGAIAFVGTGGDLLGLLGLRGPGAGGGGGSLTGAEGETAPEEAGGASLSRGPRLLGSERIARAGKGAVRGRALDVRTGKPVGGTSATITGRGLAGESVSVAATGADDGTFHLLAVPAGEAYVLRLEALGQPGRTVPGVTVTADGVTDLGDLWLGKTSLLLGTVVDPAGQPVTDAEVDLHRGIGSLEAFLRSGGFMEFFANLDREPEPLLRTRSKAGGAFRFEQAPPGPLSLLVRAPGYRQAIVSLTLTGEGGTETVRVRLAAGTSLAGRVVDGEGQGLEGVHLTAFAEEGGMPTPLARTFARSGPGGAFRFESLSGEGRHTVIGTAAGYPSAWTHGDAGAGDVRLVMRRGATLEATFVTLEGGAPLAGAQILLAVGDKSEMNDGGPGSLVGGLADAQGKVTFEVRPGALQMVLANGSDFPTAIWAGQRGARNMPGMMVGPDDTTVKPGTTRFTFKVPRGVRVHGRVLDLEGRPLAGAEVTAMSFLGRAGTTVSAADGRYELAMTAQMGGMVRASLPGYVQDRTERPGAGRPSGGAPDDAEEDDEGPAGLDPKEQQLDLILRPAASLSGRVLGPDDKPVAGATVSAFPVKEKKGFEFDFFSSPPSSLSLADGSFLIDGVPAGQQVRLVARREGFVDGGAGPVEVAREGVTSGPEVRLLGGASLEVRVVGADGQPLAGARVKAEVQRDDGVEGGRLEDFMERSSGQHDHRTGPGGTAEVTLLPPGRVTLNVSAPGHAPGGARTQVKATGEGPAAVTVRLKAGITLEGTVLDADGKPVEGARVQALDRAPRPRVVRTPAPPPPPDDGDDGEAVPVPAVQPSDEGPEGEPEEDWVSEWDRSRRTTTDAEGRWRLVDLADKPYRLRATADGYRMSTQDLGTERRGIQLRLTAQPAVAKERLEAIDKELGGLYGQLQGTTGAEQQKLLERIQALQKERTALAGD